MNSFVIAGLQLSNTLRLAALNVIQNTPWEKFVRRLGCVAVNEGRNTNEIDVTMVRFTYLLFINITYFSCMITV